MFNPNRVRASENAPASLPPVPITSVNQLVAMGYTCTHFPESWEDVGGPESGPEMEGGPAYDIWSRGQQYYAVVDGAIVDSGVNPPEFEDIPF